MPQGNLRPQNPASRERRRDEDQQLLAELAAAPALEEAPQSYQYWRGPRDRLPRYGRNERREAELMATRWRQRLDAARRERYGPTAMEQLLDSLGVRRRPDLHRLLRRLGLLAVLATVVMIAAIVATIAFWSGLQPIIPTITGGGGSEAGG